MEASWASWGPLGGVSGPLGGVLGPLRSVMEPPCGVLGAPWGVLGASWGRLGGVLGVLGASWSVLARRSGDERKREKGNPPEFEDLPRETSTFARCDRYKDSGPNPGRGLPALRGGPPRGLGPRRCWRVDEGPPPWRGPKRSRHPSFFASCRYLASSCRLSCPS